MAIFIIRDKADNIKNVYEKGGVKVDMQADRYKKKYLVRFANLEKHLFIETKMNKAELEALQHREKIQVLHVIDLEELKGEMKL